MAVEPFKQHHPVIHPTAYVHPTALIIGKVIIEAECSIWPYAVLRGDLEPIHVGRGTNIQEHVTIHTNLNAPVRIGEYVTVGHQACIHGAIIHDHVLVGMGSMLLDNAEIHTESIIGAKALITAGKVVEARSLMLGAPAKKIRDVTDQEILATKENAREYLRLMKEHQE